MTCIIDIFQFYSKSEHKYVKGFEIKGVVYKSDSFFFLFTTWYTIYTTFEIYFLKNLIAKVNDSSPQGKISFI